MTYIRLFLLSLIVVFIVDTSGAVASVKHLLSRWLLVPIKRLKPFDCSLCMVFWIGISYLLATGTMTMAHFAFVCVMALLASEMSEALLLFKDIIGLALQKMFTLLSGPK